MPVTNAIDMQVENAFGKQTIMYVVFSGRSVLRDGRNTVLGALFRKKELAVLCGELGEFCVSSMKNSVSSLWHTNNRLRGTH